MARMHVIEQSHEQLVMNGLHGALGRRMAVSSLAPCPVEFTAACVRMCATQSCGKCTPCRVGLRVLAGLLDAVLENRADASTLEQIERAARTICLSSDCAVGYEAGEMALAAVRGFHDDLVHHVTHQSCGFSQSELVPCVSGCPARVDIPGYMALVEEGRFTDAVRLIRRDNPLPIACAYVCEHPCEIHCRRGMVDEPLNIRAIKRHAVDHAEDYDASALRAPATGRRVAVVGGGPAGLSAAYYLALMGHEVTIMEARHHLGGMLRYGIPAHRLPREELEREVGWILSLGIEARTDAPVGDLQALVREYDAVYLAIGAHADVPLGLPGADAPGVVSALWLLRALGDDAAPDYTGKEVVVVGGGNVAMDAARTCLRLGARAVTVVYHRRLADMTAQDDEIAGAVREGCHLEELLEPLAVQVGEGRARGLVARRLIVGGLEDGQVTVRPLSEEVTIPADVVVSATGQAVDARLLAGQGVLTDQGLVVTQPDQSVPGLAGVFAGGDCATGPSTVVRAISAGKVAARNIDAYLGFDHVLPCNVSIPPVRMKGKASCLRSEMALRDVRRPAGDFGPVELGLGEEQARQEASRCLRCDHFGYGSFRGGRAGEW